MPGMRVAALLVLVGLPLLAKTGPPLSAPAPPVELTTQQDHQNMKDQLGIKTLRPGPSGNAAPGAPNAANYDPEKANPYPDLPDPLTLKNGRKVTTADAWWKQRRPEIVEDFEREVYGRIPAGVPAVKWELKQTVNTVVAGVPVVAKQLAGHVDNSSYPAIAVDIQMTLVLPANRKSRVPVLMMFSNAALPPSPPPVGSPAGPLSSAQQVIAAGWGYASISPASIQADNGAGLTRGIIGLVNKGQARKPDDWGALRAWAWGASRLLDYLETNPEVDAKRAVIEGVSRFGKAALVTMAYEPRYAIGFIGSSGMGGATLHRRRIGELLENVAGSGEYHWMAGNYIKYAGPLTPKDLPVDSHQLIALSAPRPLFIGAGAPEQGDAWVDPRGMFMATVAAGPVYRLLGKRALDTDVFPPVETPLTEGDLAYRQHAGGHTSGPNWPIFLDFAARYFGSGAG